MGKGFQDGFTLIEVLIVICMVGVLALVVFPSYIQQREKNMAYQLANEFRSYASTFSTYSEQNGEWNFQENKGALPDAILKDMRDIEKQSVVGGQWELSSDEQHHIELRLVKHHASITLLERVDFLLDDGNLSSGLVTGDQTHLTLVMPN